MCRASIKEIGEQRSVKRKKNDISSFHLRKTKQKQKQQQKQKKSTRPREEKNKRRNVSMHGMESNKNYYGRTNTMNGGRFLLPLSLPPSPSLPLTPIAGHKPASTRGRKKFLFPKNSRASFVSFSGAAVLVVNMLLTALELSVFLSLTNSHLPSAQLT